LKIVVKGSGRSRAWWSCYCTPDSRYFLTGSRDKRFIVWEPTTVDDVLSYEISGQPLVCRFRHISSMNSCILPNGFYLVAIGWVVIVGYLSFCSSFPIASKSDSVALIDMAGIITMETKWMERKFLPRVL